MKESFKIRNKKTGEFSLGGMNPSWGRDGKTWNGIGPLRLHLRQFQPGKLADWEVIRFKMTITSAVPAIDLYEVGSRPTEDVDQVDDSIDAARFRFCLKWGWPKPKARWDREEPHNFEFWLPAEEMSVCICRAMTMEESIDMAMQKVKEADEREARGELN